MYNCFNALCILNKIVSYLSNKKIKIYYSETTAELIGWYIVDNNFVWNICIKSFNFLNDIVNYDCSAF